jgi:hypothetical protein
MLAGIVWVNSPANVIPMRVVEAEMVPRIPMMHVMVLYVVDYTRQPSSLDPALLKHKIAHHAKDLLMFREIKSSHARRLQELKKKEN